MTYTHYLPENCFIICNESLTLEPIRNSFQGKGLKEEQFRAKGKGLARIAVVMETATDTTSANPGCRGFQFGKGNIMLFI